MEQLNGGLIDAALIFTDSDRSQYQGFRLPGEDTLGLLMRRDNPLEERKVIKISDLKNLPLIVPRAALDLLFSHTDTANISIVTVYNRIYKASLLVEDGVGYVIGFKGRINTTGDSLLTFRPHKGQMAERGNGYMEELCSVPAGSQSVS